MGPDVGIALTAFPVQGLEKVRDLEFFEGPLLTEFRSPGGDTYLYSWCAAGEHEHRWMVFRTSRMDVAKFTHQRMTLLELVRSCRDGFVYLLDLGTDAEVHRVQLCTLEQLPKNYLPADNSFFDPSLMPEGKWTHDILLDGRWELSDLSDFSKKYKDVYSFLYLLGERPAGASGMRHLHHDIRGGRGFAAQRLYNELARQVPPNDRPHLEAVQYASPGIISIRLNLDTADIIPKAVARFAQHEAELAKTYREVYKSTHDQLERSDEQIRQAIRRLVQMLGFIDWDMLCELAETTGQLADVVLAHYRRIEDLFEYQRQGKATIL
jgi:hypothetical protein